LWEEASKHEQSKFTKRTAKKPRKKAERRTKEGKKGVDLAPKCAGGNRRFHHKESVVGIRPKQGGRKDVRGEKDN